jgi:streptogramin lyase
VSGLPDGPLKLRVRRVGWKPHEQPVASPAVTVVLERETDAALVAAQLPANRWYHLLLERIEDPAHREVFVRQCTYCHQQGNWATRKQRELEEWEKIFLLMGRMGAFLPNDLRAELPALFNAAYDPMTAVPALTVGLGEPGFAPPPPADVRRAVVDEYELGGRASMQHDIVMARDGRVYSVDMAQDQLHRLDVSGPEPVRESWTFPDAGLPIGGVFGSGRDNKTPSNAAAHVGPHSIQEAPDGSLWVTLAIGNRLGRFDPKTEEFSLVDTHEGWYPHTLRFDGRGRIWYTLAASNHVGMYDPATGQHELIRLPAASVSQALMLRMLPFWMWLSKHVDLRGQAAGAGEGMAMPVPYGIDVGPDGVVWLTQLNEHKLVRVDPDTFEVEMIDTPFFGPRRLRFDSTGSLWIPAFSSGLISRFDPQTRAFQSWELPIEPKGSDVPYALNVDRRTDTVWICGTNSDTLIRFDPESERFTVFPLPTRVTFTREIDFDAEGRVWTSNSNAPTWQIEGGYPRVLRLDPDGLRRAQEVAQQESTR